MGTLPVLSALADETRLRILSLLLAGQDLCSCEIQAILRVNQSNLSRHLSRLRQAGLIIGDKRGRWVHFRVDQDAWESYVFVAQIVESARTELPVLSDDTDLLHDYRHSGFTCTTIAQWEVSAFTDR